MMFEWYDQIQRDVRLAGRRASKQATFTTLVIACVALGVAAVTSALSILHPVLLQALPFERPGELVQIAAYNVNRVDQDERYFISWYPIDVLERERKVLQGVAGFYLREFNAVGEGQPERIPGAETLPGSFEVLGVRPLLGRGLTAEDVREGRRVALISEALWERRYGRDPGVTERLLHLDERAYRVVGVIPGTVRLSARADVFPVHLPDDYSDRERMGLGVFLTIGRLPPGADVRAAQSDLDAMLAEISAAEPIFYRDFGFDAMGLREFLVGDVRRPVIASLAAALLVLLLATANVATLLLARAEGEVWERGLRTALGARRRRIASQSVVENALIVGAGSVAGVFLAGVGVRALVGVSELGNPLFDSVGISAPVVGAAAAVAGVLVLVLSVGPACRCYRALDLLRAGRGAGGRSRRRTQTGFVVGQVSLAFVLLVAAALMARTGTNLAALDLGFDTDRLVIARITAPATESGTAEARAAFSERVLERLEALPGIEAAGATSWVPLEDPDVGFNYSVQDHPPELSGERALAPGRIITPGYFGSMGIPVLAGRDFTRADGEDGAQVAIVSRAFEERYWPDGNALGRRIKRGAYNGDRPWIEIVGVVGDVRSGVVSDSIRPALFYPLAQSEGAYLSELAYTVRTAGDGDEPFAAIRAAVAEIAPGAAVYRESTGARVRTVALGSVRFNALLIGLFALVGVVLATAGVFGVTSYGVNRRVREFGVRTAFGANPRDLPLLVLRQSLLVAGLGLTVGVTVALVLTSGLSNLLYGVESADAATYVAVALLLLAAVLTAAYLPARRATCVDPALSLRHD